MGARRNPRTGRPRPVRLDAARPVGMHGGRKRAEPVPPGTGNAGNDTPAWAPTFERIKRDHESAAEKLRARVLALKGTPDASAGAWGGWAELVAKGSAALGDGAARDALRIGEQHGVSEYDEALASAKVDDETKSLIRGTLLPLAKEHVRALEALKK